jgi:hypothetical protein
LILEEEVPAGRRDEDHCADQVAGAGEQPVPEGVVPAPVRHPGPDPGRDEEHVDEDVVGAGRHEAMIGTKIPRIFPDTDCVVTNLQTARQTSQLQPAPLRNVSHAV